jgi:murein endopeptidase
MTSPVDVGLGAIGAPVGSRGANHPDDVRVVQELLNGHVGQLGLRPLLVDGQAGRKTVVAIVEFQGRVMGMLEPDGRVDPAGRTWRALTTGRPALVQLPTAATGYYSYARPAQQFGTAGAIASVARAAGVLAAEGLEIGIGHISLAGGGRFPPHASHQQGLDVDLRPLRGDGARRAVTISDSQYSRDRTARVVQLLQSDSNLERILFNDGSIAGVTPHAGHDNHLHVRFRA